MVYNSFTLPPGLAFLYEGNAFKTVYVPYFKKIVDFLAITEENCEFNVYLDNLYGGDSIKFGIPIGEFEHIDDLGCINATICDLVLEFFDTIVQECYCFVYKSGEL